MTSWERPDDVLFEGTPEEMQALLNAGYRYRGNLFHNGVRDPHDMAWRGVIVSPSEKTYWRYRPAMTDIYPHPRGVSLQALISPHPLDP